MPNVQTRFGRVYYDEAGAGHPVVLLHATLHCRRDYCLIVPRLAENFRVVSLDWPGHGASELPTFLNSITAASLADLLEE